MLLLDVSVALLSEHLKSNVDKYYFISHLKINLNVPLNTVNGSFYFGDVEQQSDVGVGCCYDLLVKCSYKSKHSPRVCQRR